MYTSIAHKIPDHSRFPIIRVTPIISKGTFEQNALIYGGVSRRHCSSKWIGLLARVVPTSLTSLQWEACPPTAASGWEFIGKCDSHELTYYNCRLVTAEWKKSPFRIGAFQKPCTPSLSRCKMTMVRMFSWLGRDCFWKMSRVKTSTRCDILCSRILISFIFC